MKLIDNMVFHLAALPKETYDTLLHIFEIYESSRMQGKKTDSKPDCPGANFRELQSLDDQTVCTVLEEIENEELPLSHLNRTCKII